MAKQHVVVIEDEKNIVELLKYQLETAGYKVSVAMRGDLGLEMVQKEKPDLVLLDLMLPEMDGIQICKSLKQNYKTSHIPIVMVTAKGEETDKVLGLELEADDYVSKPFSSRELMARVKAVMRRVKPKSEQILFKAGDLEVDTAKHLVHLKGKPLAVTSKEYDLLVALMDSGGRVLSREYLLEEVWGYDQSLNIETRTVDMHIGQLRKKLKHEADRVVTVKNVGYRFE